MSIDLYENWFLYHISITIIIIILINVNLPHHIRIHGLCGLTLKSQDWEARLWKCWNKSFMIRCSFSAFISKIDTRAYLPSTFASPALSRTEYDTKQTKECAQKNFHFHQNWEITSGQRLDEPTTRPCWKFQKMTSLWWPQLSLASRPASTMATKASILAFLGFSPKYLEKRSAPQGSILSSPSSHHFRQGLA